MLRKLTSALVAGLVLLTSFGAAGQVGGTRIPVLSAPAIYSAPQADPFDGGVGTVNLRAYQGGTWSYMAAQTANTNTTAVGVNGSGLLSGNLSNTNGNANVTYVQTKYPDDDTLWITIQPSRTYATPFAENNLVIAPLYTGDGTTNSFNHSSITWSSSGNSGSLNLKKNLATTSGNTSSTNVTGGTASNIQFMPGDPIQIRQRRIGSNLIWDWWQDGVQIRDGSTGTAFNFTSSGITDSKVFGVYGAIGAASLDRVEFCRPLVDACLSLRNGNRVAQLESDGSVILKLRAEYTRGAPKNLFYTVFDASNDTPVSGHQGVAWVDYQAGGGIASGKTQKISSPPASFYVTIERRDVAGGSGKAISTGPPIKAGQVWLTYGQSLNQQLDDTDNGAATGSAQSADGWSVSARNDGIYTTEETQRTLRFAAGTPNAFRYDKYQAATGVSTPIAMLMGGKGGTFWKDRVPGSATSPQIFQALLDGLDRNGGDFSTLIDISGTFDTQGSTEWNALVTNYQATIDALEAKVGHSIVVLVNPVGAVRNSTDAGVETVRRIQTKLTVDYPSRYFLGVQSFDLQHNNGDDYHLTKAAYGVNAGRIGYQLAYLKGATTYDSRGPYATAIAVTSSNTLDVTYTLPPRATGARITNQAAQGTASISHLGGQAFNSGTSCATVRTAVSPLNPTDVTVGTVSAGQVVVTYTFAGTPFSGGHAVWRGPYGFNPYNPGQTSSETTINNNFATAASMFQATFPSDNPLPLQPYFNWAGPADGSSDCLTY